MRVIKKDKSISWEEITEILHDAYSKHLKNGINFYAAYQDAEVTKRRAEKLGGVSATFVALEENEPIATISCYIKDGNKNYEGNKACCFHMFGVKKAYQGRRIGKLLLEQVICFAKENNCDYLVCDTSEKAKDLIKMYSKNMKPVDYVHHGNTNYFSVFFSMPLNDKVDNLSGIDFKIIKFKYKVKYYTKHLIHKLKLVTAI